MDQQSSLYELTDVTRTYQVGSATVRALSEAKCTISTGEMVSIEGPSGSGKSTLLLLLGILETPTSGTLLFKGTNLRTTNDETRTTLRRESIGFVFQHFNLIPTLTAQENVLLPMVPMTGTKSDKRERAHELLKQVGLGHRMGHLPGTLSGGEQQRVAIARALANRPDVIIADEPTGNLDSASAQGIMDLLTHLNEDEHVTILLATHDPAIAKRTNRHIMLRDGQLLEDQATPVS
ncbi:MAG: ABC transporter ATP-binding protein [Candidatus Dormibacteria bacterium]